MLSELFRLDHIMGVCEKILYFFAVNLMFVVCNIPVLLFLLFVGPEQIRICLPLFLVSMVPMAPALCAVFYAMNRLVRGLERGALSDYWKGYRQDWGRNIRLGALQAFTVLVAWTNLEFFTRQVPVTPLAVVFGILFALLIVITPNLYLMASRYEMGIPQIIKAALTLTIARPVHTLGTVAALGLVLMSVELCAGTTVLFMASVYGFLVTFMAKRVLNELEKGQSKA